MLINPTHCQSRCYNIGHYGDVLIRRNMLINICRPSLT